MIVDSLSEESHYNDAAENLRARTSDRQARTFPTMFEDNPYQSPAAALIIAPEKRAWKGGSDSVLVSRGLLQRKVVINRPVDVTIEYIAKGLRDRVLVDGKTVISIFPILWLSERFKFKIPYCDGSLPVEIDIKIGRGSLRIKRFRIVIDEVVAYNEFNGLQQTNNE